MSTPDWSEVSGLLIGIAAVIGSIFGPITAWRQRKTERATNTLVHRVDDVHEATNGMKDALIKLEKEKSFRAGEVSEREAHEKD